jgi:hypothetical protein
MIGFRATARLGSARHWLVWLAVLLTTTGCLHATAGSLMPAYIDAEAAERIRTAQECEPGVPNTNLDRRCTSAQWHQSMSSLRTNKWPFVDAGGGLLLSGVMLCVFLWWSRNKLWRELRTPRHGLWIVALASAAWLMQIPVYDLQFITELARGDHPHWADSVAIPMSEVQNMLLWLLLPYGAIWLPFVIGTRLPAPIFSSAQGRPLVNAFWNGMTALLLLPVILVLIGAILDGPTLMVPFLWLTVWLALCARAAALTRHRANPE